MKFRVIIEQDEDGIFVANCPTLPGCISQGKTRAEAQANIKEAIQGYLESLSKHDEPAWQSYNSPPAKPTPPSVDYS
jgi:antitoxin HicB